MRALETTQAWQQLSDPQGFRAKWGPRTTELRAPCYNYTQFKSPTTRHECNWNGPTWPFETSKLISGMASLLLDYPTQAVVTREAFMEQLLSFARQHTKGFATNGVSPWIGEVMHPDTGVWLARSLMYGAGRADKDRGIWCVRLRFPPLRPSFLPSPRWLATCARPGSIVAVAAAVRARTCGSGVHLQGFACACACACACVRAHSGVGCTLHGFGMTAWPPLPWHHRAMLWRDHWGRLPRCRACLGCP